MNSSADAADEVVKMYLQGIEMTARVSGTAAKHVAAFLYAVMKDKKQTQGKTKLKNMLKSNSKLKVFSIRQKDLSKFSKEAKRYGVLYCLLTSKLGKKDPNKLIDIMVREEDAPRINRIVDKFKLTTYDKASVHNEVENVKVKENNDTRNELMSDNKNTKSLEEHNIINPKKAMTEKDPLSEPFCETKINSGVASNKSKKLSVRKALKEINNELKMQGEHEKTKEDIRKGKDTKVINVEKKTVVDYSMNNKNNLKKRKQKFGKVKSR